MSDYWGDMTVADLEEMGVTLDDFEQMMEEGNNPLQPSYSQMGVLPPMNIGGADSQQSGWDLYNAQKTARELSAPPSGYERRLDRSFEFPDPTAFPYDAVQQSNPYLRTLLNSAISNAEPGPNQPFDVREYIYGRVGEDEGADPDDVGKTRIGQAVTSAMDDFDYIADEFHSDDRRWATTDRKERRQLLREWLSDEAEANLAGSAPSVARNVGFSDWALQRETGDPFPGYSGPGFDQAANQKGAPRVQTDQRFFGKNVYDGAEAEMSLGDFRKAYQDSLGDELDGPLRAGKRIADPERGGYWVIAQGGAGRTPLDEARSRNARMARRERQRDDEDQRGRNRNGTNPVSRWWNTTWGNKSGKRWNDPSTWVQRPSWMG